ncbi:hypothetical protein GCM10020220_011500 [Nonomuraea rubra]|uniref:hypothetical protein n=1 Tax=Nonomuraea rubra TaxID=46180 RepID=UPI0031EA2013
MAIATETGRVAQQTWETDIGQEILPDDSLERVLGVVSGNDIRLIQETRDQLDLAVVEKVAQAVARAGRGAAVRGVEQRRRGQRDGVPAAADARTDLEQVRRPQRAHRRGAARPGRRGDRDLPQRRTREVIEVLAEAGSHGAITVAVTSQPRSPLPRWPSWS